MSKNSNHNLTRRRLIGAAAAICLLTVSRIGFAADSTVVAIRIWPSSTYSRITIEATQTLKFKQLRLVNPDRLVVDIQGVQLNSLLQNIGQQISSDDPYIKTIRAGQFDSSTIRLVIKLKTDIKPQLFTLAPVAGFKHRLVVDLYPAKPQQNDPLLALLEDYNDGTLDSPDSAPPAPAPKGKPGSTRPIIVMLDPGHGGEDPGAVGPSGTREKDVVLKIAKQLKQMIERERNMKVYLTREDDVFIPLGVRVAKARKLRADIFISIHADAFTTPAAQGSSVFALSDKVATSTAAKFLAQTQNEADRIGGVKIAGKDRYLMHTLFDLTQTATINDSLKLGKQVLGKIGQLNTLHKNRVEQAGFAVLKAPDIPSVLVETAFISNPEEERRLRDSAFQRKMAASILDGVKTYFSKRV